MFDIPVAKRVRRADLYLSPSSPSPEPSEPDLETTTLLHSQLESIYGPVLLTDNHASGAEREGEAVDAHAEPREPKGEGFEFRLFASPPVSRPHSPGGAKTNCATRIILDDDNDTGDPRQRGGFIVPGRNPEYYFSDAVVPPSRVQERKREFEIAAVSGEDVRRWLGVRYSGWEVGWRVKHLRLRNGELVAAEADKGASKPLVGGLDPDWQGEERFERCVGDGKKGKPGKPGKKRRIVLRTRKRRVEEAAERRREEKRRKLLGDKEREEAEREKRTRRNREKKVKKKMKEKEKKAHSHGGGLDTTVRNEKSEEK